MKRALLTMMRPLPPFLTACTLGLAVGLGYVPGACAGEGIESLARVRAVARATAAASTGRPAAELEVAPLDPRLHLAECEGAPAGRLTPGARSQAQLTIEVYCTSPPWRQYVVVRVQAEEKVVIATRALARLQVVAAEDVTVLPRELASLPAGYFRRAEDVVGHIAQRNVGAGEVLSPGTVRAPPLVHRGQSVTLLVSGGGLSVRASGTVLADAGLAERVRVKNAQTSRLVEGVVRSADTVEVSLE